MHPHPIYTPTEQALLDILCYGVHVAVEAQAVADAIAVIEAAGQERAVQEEHCTNDDMYDDTDPFGELAEPAWGPEFEE